MNTFIEGKDFWISYNPFTDKGAETALCREKARPNYLILLGDYTADFEPLVPQGYDACLEKLKQLLKDGAQMSGWSESLEDETEDQNDQYKADKEEREIEYAESHYHPAEGNE
jgi:predicted MPP superfamily phosphohydrolase